MINRIDQLIKDIIEEYFQDGHTRISARIIAKKTGITLQKVTYCIRNNLQGEYKIEKRSRGFVVVRQYEKEGGNK
jgi:hypothetical protein